MSKLRLRRICAFEPRPGLACAVIVACVCVRATAAGADGPDAGDATPVRIDRGWVPQTGIDRMAQKHDARLDDWRTENLNEDAGRQLKKLSKLIKNPQMIDVDHVGSIVAEDFTYDAAGLQPGSQGEVFRDGRFVVKRWTGRVEPRADGQGQTDGPKAMAGLLRSLTDGLGEGPGIHNKLKLVSIDTSERFFTTVLYYEASNRSAGRGVQQNAVWRCRWTYPDTPVSQDPQNDQSETQLPLMRHLTLERFEQIDDLAGGGALFADCTVSAMGRNASYAGQVLPGLGHWLERISLLDDISQFGHHGIAVGDVNADGLDDLYVCDAGGLPNRLYVQNPDGTVTDVSAHAGVDWLDNSAAALLIDLDNDGAQDLVVLTVSDILFARNDGRGRFTLRTNSDEVTQPLSLSAADYDGDGDLDLYVCGYGYDSRYGGPMVPIPYHDANNGDANALLRNDGDFRFVNVTEQVGLEANNRRFSMAASWEDYDNDGDQDLYVANDFGRNNLYRNDGGRFSDVAASAAVEDTAAGMSVSWADYNRDGWMDLYVGNMFSAAGRRVTYQRRFVQSRPGGTVAQIQRMARGNTLFANGGDGSAPGFHDVSEAAAVFMGRWAWSSLFADLNNDSWPDIVVANGYVTGDDKPGDL